jgi:predicted exporter
VSLGFASILFGLAEDFGIVLYRNRVRTRNFQLRKCAAWRARYLVVGDHDRRRVPVLNLSGLPGLGQLGSLVAIGIVLAAGGNDLSLCATIDAVASQNDEDDSKLRLFAPVRLLPTKVIWFVTALCLLSGAWVLWRQGVRFDRSPDALKPRNSQAYAAVEQMKKRLGRPDEPAWVIVRGNSEADVAQKLGAVERWLQRGVGERAIKSFTLPTPLWPKPDQQQVNREVLRGLVRRGAEVSKRFWRVASRATRSRSRTVCLRPGRSRWIDPGRFGRAMPQANGCSIRSLARLLMVSLRWGCYTRRTTAGRRGNSWNPSRTICVHRECWYLDGSSLAPQFSKS